MEFQSAHESATEIGIEEQSEVLQTETEMAAEVVQEKSSATTSTELQFNMLIPLKNHAQRMAAFSENCKTYIS